MESILTEKKKPSAAAARARAARVAQQIPESLLNNAELNAAIAEVSFTSITYVSKRCAHSSAAEPQREKERRREKERLSRDHQHLFLSFFFLPPAPVSIVLYIYPYSCHRTTTLKLPRLSGACSRRDPKQVRLGPSLFSHHHLLPVTASRLPLHPLAYSTVALQFPEGLLMFACTISDILEKCVVYALARTISAALSD